MFRVVSILSPYIFCIYFFYFFFFQFFFGEKKRDKKKIRIIKEMSLGRALRVAFSGAAGGGSVGGGSVGGGGRRRREEEEEARWRMWWRLWLGMGALRMSC